MIWNSLLTIATIVSLPVLVFGVSSFWMRHSPFYLPKLAEVTRLGTNAFESFLVRLRPMLVFALAATLKSLAGLWHRHSYTAGAASGAYVMNAFFLSGGLAFAVAHIVLYFRKAVGVYPTWREKLLPEALRTYWWTLTGLALFPSIFFVGGEFLHIPFEFFMLPFFAVGFLAGWP